MRICPTCHNTAGSPPLRVQPPGATHLQRTLSRQFDLLATRKVVYCFHCEGSGQGDVDSKVTKRLTTLLGVNSVREGGEKS